MSAGPPADTTPPTGHQLTEITVADEPESWADAGFVVDDGRVIIGSTRVVFAGADTAERGIRSIAVDDLTSAIAGLPTHDASPSDAAQPDAVDHPNTVSAIDHLVVMTPNCDRTTAELEAAGIEARRVRTFGKPESETRQTFFWLGDVILELVGADTGAGDGPAELWGLALTAEDLDRAAAHLGDKITPPKTAVQAGRQIATIKTRDLDISTALALLSPHPRRS